MKLIALASLLTACTFHKPVKPKNDLELLREKFHRYFAFSLEQADEYGWLSTKCDGLLFNSLAATAGLPINIMAAEESPGRWRRHPDFSICKPGAGSDATISRDMFRGLFIYLIHQKNKDAMRRIKAYGEANQWFMGEAVNPTTAIARVWFNPIIRNQLDRMIDKNYEAMTAMTADDYEAHLDVLRIYTELLISGKIDDIELKTLKDYTEKSPENALFQALYHLFDGDQSKAIAILMDERRFPSDRLPTDRDHFAHYLWERDPGPDWDPCLEEGEKRRCKGLTHSGIDFLFVAWLVLN
jgi:hypothetical protein